MGFLYGVLSNIKEHLGQHKGEITDAITSLDTNKHGGKKGFNAAIGSVVEGVREYNDNVRKGNEKVKKPIIALLQKVNDAFKKRINEIDGNIDIRRPKFAEEAVESADRLLEECLQNAKVFNETFDIVGNRKDIYNAINDLNYVLRDKVNNARESVKLETQRFGELTKKQRKDLREMAEKTERSLTDLGNCVNREIKNNVTRLVNDMKERVTKIKEKLVSINEGLRTYVQKLQEWIAKVEPFIVSALEKVKTILAEVNWQYSDKYPKQVESTVEQIKVDAMMLMEAGNEAKQKVQTEVTAALRAVRTMDGELKEDLYEVKKAIKDAIISLGVTLKDNVNKDLTVLKAKMTAPLEEILGKSTTFSERFSATQKVLDKAIQAIHDDIGRLADLSKIVGITGVDTKLLQHIATTEAFGDLRKYFNKLSEEVMRPLKKAMEGIGKGYAGISQRLNSDELCRALKAVKADSDIEALQQVVGGTVPSTDLNGINTLLGVQIKKIDLTRYRSNIQSVIEKLVKNSISKNNLQSLLAYLSSIAQEVSVHSKEVVDESMKALKSKIEDEVRSVANELNKKVKDCRTAIISEGAPMTLKNIQGVTDPVSGIKALVTDFETYIQSKVNKLQIDIKNTILKSDATRDATGESYYLPNVMPSFNSTHVNHLQNATIRHNGGDDVLTDQIGRDNLSPRGGKGKISSLGEKVFHKYKQQVSQTDDLVIAERDPNNLSGTLPNAIKKIKTDVEGALTNVENLKIGIDQQAALILEHLNKLCNNIIDAAMSGEKRDGLQLKLTELKDTYFKNFTEGKRDAQNSIKSIQHHLHAFQEELQSGPIRAASDFITDVPKIGERTISSLNRHVVTQVQEVIKELKHKANEAYVTTTQLLLNHFADRVTAHLKGLPEAIEKDKHTGFKGFMEAFEGKPEVKPREKWAIHVAREEPSRLEAFRAAVTTPRSSKKEEFETLSEAFKHFWSPLASYVNKEIVRLNEEENDKKHPVVKDVFDYHGQLMTVYDRFNEALTHIHTTHRYDHILPGLLDDVDAAIANLKPDGFAKPSSPVIDGLIAGLTHFVGELRRAYISTYDSVTFGELVKNPNTEKSELTKEGRNVAKTFLTLLNTVVEDLTTLDKITATYCKTETLCLNNVGRPSGSQSLNPLGDYFHQRGYKVPSKQNTRDGELQYRTECNGRFINRMLLNNKLKNVDSIAEHLKACDSNKDERTQLLMKEDKFNIFDLLKCIYHHVDKYNEVCHLATFNATRSPCSVYEMLIWLSGLTHSGVHPAMVSKTFLDLLRDPAKEARLAAQDNDDGELQISFGGSDPIALDAYPKNIEFVKLGTTLTHICSKAYDVICKIVGTGDEYTTYGCDYSNNSFKLKYPSDPAACFDMLLDILRRLLPALRYIFQRCNVTTEHHGWRNCEYGKDVPTSKSHCTNKATDKATTQPTCQAKCQPTSPLMSYLNDCLPGHLPHSLTDIGCKSVCRNCPSAAKLGMPCLTPMGFRGFSGSTKTGADLCEIIREFLGSGLVASLFCLVPTPPKTLPEHFGFVTCLVGGLAASTSAGKSSLKVPIESSITKQTIKLYDQPNKLTETLHDAYASAHTAYADTNHLPAYADLSSLVIPQPCTVENVQCAPYLSSLACDNYNYLAHKNAATYLSWAVYLPWDFWNQLNNLYTAFKNIFCQDWGCHMCLRADICKRGQHGLVEQKEGERAKPHCKCPSMVQCKGVSATLYQFGFCFGNAATLNNETSPKMCSDFCSQLDRVLKSNYFVKLFTECDEFLWIIRQPFSYLVLALWSLSLFYLICVMVGRLDVLHIRSHLRIPSSHKITAQSLLAAAQVGRLAKISYLQP